MPAKLKAFLEISAFLIREPRLGRRLLRGLPVAGRALKAAATFPGLRPPHATDQEAQGQASNPLAAYLQSHVEGKGVWKWNHYLETYHRHFGKFVGREVHILEVGVYSGGSLEMWRHYFGSGCRVYGVDIRPECRVHEDRGTRIFIGDQTDRAFWRSVREQVPRLDIVVDDGGHRPVQQIVTLEEMLPHLRPGGVYLCEDIHGCPNDFATYAHALAFDLNETRETGGPVLAAEATAFQSAINSVHFYPFVTVFEKADRPRQRFVAPKHGTEWQTYPLG